MLVNVGPVDSWSDGWMLKQLSSKAPNVRIVHDLLLVALKMKKNKLRVGTYINYLVKYQVSTNSD